MSGGRRRGNGNGHGHGESNASSSALHTSAPRSILRSAFNLRVDGPCARPRRLLLRVRSPLLLSKSPFWLRIVITNYFADLAAGAVSPCPKNYSHDSSTGSSSSGPYTIASPAFKIQIYSKQRLAPVDKHAPASQSHTTLDSTSWRPTWNPPLRSRPCRKTATMTNNPASLTKQPLYKRQRTMSSTGTGQTIPKTR